ncbi:HK97 family phage prohead protease [Vibrio sp. T187]|uniref:HK97 family phage prohead protease n=1 Tax=Vibrio TaxID=662 RepID=UPI0010C9B584|nr:MULTISPECIES: HK97 family phage prohead protease [Vibrio]MBW3696458.1 HK97 family phage prohead protease [Vibrio sp. T187]
MDIKTKFALSKPEIVEGELVVKVAELDGVTPDRVGDVYDKDAFKNTIEDFENGTNKIAFLYSHDLERPVGAIEEFWIEGSNLMMRARLALGTPDGDLSKKMIESGAITSTSIGYMVKEQYYDNNRKVNVLVEVALHEISLVAVPADPKADIVSVKTLEELTVNDARKGLRNAGFSKRATDYILMNGYQEHKTALDTENKALDDLLRLFK